MAAVIDKLEDDKKELEGSNSKVIAENRQLLDQLEDLNNHVCDADAEIQTLTVTLQSTRQQIQRLSSLADRATELETQLVNMETEYASLQSDYTDSQDQKKTAVQRWKRAEGTISYLSEQIDKIEREAKDEHERHVEVLGRLERRRAVEKELENAAGRLKGAAAAKTLDPNSQGSSVVSHFVRDILQDNANLQMGVVELREMLMGSNTEVENLREQLLLHQPVDLGTPTLKAELGAAESSGFESIPELHVHHHYHQADKTPKRPKKKRAAITTGHLTNSGTTTPSHQRVREWRTITSSASTILSQTSVTVPPNRWSMQSSQTGASFASSIPSSPRRPSVFDPIDNVLESRPTSPETSIFGCSPPRAKAVMRSPSALKPYRSISTPAALVLPSTEDSKEQQDTKAVREPNVFEDSLQEQDLLPSPHETIPEEVETDDGIISPDPSISSFTRPRHRRAASHESLFSLASGTTGRLRQQLSQNFDVSGRGFSPVTNSFSPVSTSFAAGPSISHATATAKNVPLRPVNRLESNDSARSLLSHAGSTPPDKPASKKFTGGWAWSKWGKAPLPTSVARKTPQSPLEAALRSPGVNQMGFIKGLAPPKPAPIEVQPKTIDESSLREALDG